MRGKSGILAAMAAFVLFTAGAVQAAEQAAPTIAQPCMACHKAEENVLRGIFKNASMKAGTIQMEVGPKTYLVKFDLETLEIVGDAEAPNKIEADKEIAVHYTGAGDDLQAGKIYIKPPAKIDPAKLMGTEELAALVAKGPGKAAYTLVDSRPKPRYDEGHIPSAVNIPLPAFDKMAGKVLPKEKDALVIFYCGGVT